MVSTKGLEGVCDRISPDILEDESYILVFDFGEVSVEVRLIFDELLGQPRMTIPLMQVLPDTEVKKGYGTQALKKVLSWAENAGIGEVWAIRVFPDMEWFWTRRGFVKVSSVPNNFRLHNPRE